MAVDWEKFRSEVNDIVDEAADKIDEQLAGRISSVTSLTDDEIQEICPESSDKKKLADLMAIVKSADEENEKIDRIMTGAKEFGTIVLSLLGKFA